MNYWQIRQAARVVWRGGVIAYPTEAVYGLGCDPLNPEAVFKLLALKQRSVEKGLVVIGANFQQLEPFMAPLDADQLHTLDCSWPGPVTWLVPANPETPVWLKGHHDTIALRITSHPIATTLCQSVGHALVSTSANLSGHRPAKNPIQIRHYFPIRGTQKIDRIVVGPLGNEAKPSTIKNLITGQIVRSN